MKQSSLSKQKYNAPVPSDSGLGVEAPQTKEEFVAGGQKMASSSSWRKNFWTFTAFLQGYSFTISTQ